MKKTAHKSSRSDFAAEYDFTVGVRGKHARRFAHGTHVILLAPDVARMFPNAETVNTSLRALTKIIRHQEKVLAGK